LAFNEPFHTAAAVICHLRARPADEMTGARYLRCASATRGPYLTPLSQQPFRAACSSPAPAHPADPTSKARQENQAHRYTRRKRAGAYPHWLAVTQVRQCSWQVVAGCVARGQLASSHLGAAPRPTRHGAWAVVLAAHGISRSCLCCWLAPECQRAPVMEGQHASRQPATRRMQQATRHLHCNPSADPVFVGCAADRGE
jgi:hypothetical protein